jgi:putative phage-type endonuclease
MTVTLPVIDQFKVLMDRLAPQVICSTDGMTEEEWRARRLAGLGGSEMSAILEENPYDSALAVYYYKLQLIPPKEETESMYWGKTLETVVAEEFARRSGLSIFEPKVMLKHPLYDFMIGNVDRLVHDPELGFGVLECKTAHAMKQSEWEGNRVPVHYYIQVQHYLAVSGLDFAYIACLIGGQVFRYTVILRDEDMISRILEAGTNFWYNNILEQCPPDVSHLDADVLGKLYPWHKDGEFITMQENDIHLWDGLIEANQANIATSQKLELAKNRIKEYMGENEALFLNGEKVVTWKADKRGVKSFKPKLPKGDE